MTDSYMQGDRDNAIAVPFSDDEKAKPDEGEEEDKPTDSVEVRLTRLQKKEARTRRMLEEGRQSKDQVAALLEKQSKLETELASLRGYVAAQPQRAQNDNAKDPYEQRLDQVYERQGEAYNAAQAEIKAGTMTPERQTHYERIARDIEGEKTRIHTERAIATHAPAQRQEQAQQVWVQKYPEVYNNPKAFQYAQATWNRRLALGENTTNELVDEIMNETLTTFKLGPKRAPTQSDRSRMSGMPAAGGGGSRSTPVAMTPALRRMAEAAHSDLSPEEAWKKWTNSTGKRLRDKKVI